MCLSAAALDPTEPGQSTVLLLLLLLLLLCPQSRKVAPIDISVATHLRAHAIMPAIRRWRGLTSIYVLWLIIKPSSAWAQSLSWAFTNLSAGTFESVRSISASQFSNSLPYTAISDSSSCCSHCMTDSLLFAQSGCKRSITVPGRRRSYLLNCRIHSTLHSMGLSARWNRRKNRDRRGN